MPKKSSRFLFEVKQEVSQKINTLEDLPVEEAASDSEAFHLEPPKPSLNPNWCGSPGGSA